MYGTTAPSEYEVAIRIQSEVSTNTYLELVIESEDPAGRVEVVNGQLIRQHAAKAGTGYSLQVSKCP